LKTEWSPEEKSRLFSFHKIFGNKWSKIAENIPGRTENSIKNCFYSLIRKNLRKYNRKRTESEKIKGSIKSLLKRPKFRDILLDTQEALGGSGDDYAEKGGKEAVEIIRPQVISLPSPISLSVMTTGCSSPVGGLFNFKESLFQQLVEYNFNLLAMSPHFSQRAETFRSF